MVAGTRGSVTLPRLDTRHHGGYGWWTPIESERTIVPEEDPLTLRLRHFIEVVRGETEPLIDGREGTRTLETTVAVKRAAATGEVVPVLTRVRRRTPPGPTNRECNEDGMNARGHMLSISHLTALHATPPELVSAAAGAGFDAVGIRVWPAADEPAYPMLGDTPMMRETLARLADTGLRVLDVEVLRLRPDTGTTMRSAFSTRVSGSARAVCWSSATTLRKRGWSSGSARFARRRRNAACAPVWNL